MANMSVDEGPLQGSEGGFERLSKHPSGGSANVGTADGERYMGLTTSGDRYGIVADMGRHKERPKGKLERMDSLQDPAQMKQNVIHKIGQAAFDQAYEAIQTSTLVKTEVVY